MVFWGTPDVPELTFRSAVPADVDSILLFWNEAAEDSTGLLIRVTLWID
jgi:hypothetical protein